MRIDDKFEASILFPLLLFYITLQRLYDLGARRVLVTGTGPLGCVPAELAMRSRNGECAAELQRAATLFNPQLSQMLRELNSNYGSDVFIAANTQLMHTDFVTNPQAYGKLNKFMFYCSFWRFELMTSFIS